MRRTWPVTVAATVGIAFLALPVIGLLAQAPWSSATDILVTPEVREALLLSLLCSTCAAVLAVAAGIPLAWVLADPTTPGRGLIRALCALGLVLPPVVSGIALLAAFGPQGLVGRHLYDWFGIQLTFSTAGTVMAQTFVAFPLVVFTLEGAFRSTDERLLEAARSFGAGPWLRFRAVVLPAVRPSLAAAALLGWARALGEFGASITFAGNLPGTTQTLPLAVYELQATDQGAAVMVSLLLVAIALAVLVLLRDRWTGALR